MEWLPIDVTRVNWFSTYRVHHRVAEPVPSRTRVPARRRGAHPQSGRRAGDEHRHRRRSEPGVEAGGGAATDGGSGNPRYLRGRAMALRTAPGGDHRSRLHRGDEPESGRTDRAASRRPAADSPALLLPSDAAPDVSHDLADRCELPRQRAERRQRRTRSRRRPVAMGAGDGPDGDNFAPLRRSTGRCTCTATPSSELQSECRRRRLPLHVFVWQPTMGLKGLHRNALYLVRPDGYVALTTRDGHTTALSSYLDARQLMSFELTARGLDRETSP